MDDLIEKNEEIIGKIYEYINHKYIYFTINKELINIGDLEYIEIVKSGIDKFDDTKIYIDTSAVSQCNITDNTYVITYDDRPSRANMQPKANSVWFAKLKESPKYIIVKNSSTRIINNCIFSTGFMGLQSDANIINFLYALILSKSFNEQKDSSSTGATMMGINNDIFNSIRVPNVSKDETTCFGQSIENYIQLIINLKEKNYILKQLKQTLLSKYFD